MSVRIIPSMLLLCLSLVGCAPYRSASPTYSAMPTNDDPSHPSALAAATQSPPTIASRYPAENHPIANFYSAAMAYSVDMVTGWWKKP